LENVLNTKWIKMTEMSAYTGVRNVSDRELSWSFCAHFVLVGYGFLFFFFFIVLKSRARFRCTTPGCQLFTSGWVQHKGRNQVTVNNTPNAQPCTKLLKVFRVITKRKGKKKAIVYGRHRWSNMRKTATVAASTNEIASDNHR